MTGPRNRLAVGIGNLLELAGAGIGCYAVSCLWGVSVALLVAAVLLVVGAELVYDGTVLRVPLPRRPHPVQKARVGVQRARYRLLARVGQFRAARALR